MFNSQVKHSLVFKIVAVALIRSLIFCDIGAAATKNIFQKKKPTHAAIQKKVVRPKAKKAFKTVSPKKAIAKLGPTELKDPATITVPRDYGTIIETYQPDEKKTDKIIIHIQDAHCNYSGQKNLSHILGQFINQYGLKLILVEGGSDNASLSFLREYGTKETRQKVAEKYLKEGKISGEEYLDIISDYDMMVWGIEDEELYKKDGDAFFAIDAIKKSSLNYLESLKKASGDLKNKIYPKALLEFEGKKKDFDDEKLPILDYYKYLAKKARDVRIKQGLHPNLSAFLEASQLEEKIDFTKVEKERNKLLDSLSKSMPKAKLSKLLSKSMDFKLKKVSPAEYYGYLVSVAKENKKSGVEQLSLYTKYLSQFEQIDHTKLIKESESLVEDVSLALIRNRDQKRLYQISKNLKIMEEFLQIHMTPEEFDYFQANKKDFVTLNWAKFLDKALKKYKIARTVPTFMSPIDKNLEQLESFYTIARKRDEAFIKNSIAKMNAEKLDLAVLITGGFHTPQLTQMFKEEGMSYAVISPRITEPTDPELYHEVLKYKSVSLEEYLENPEKYHYRPMPFLERDRHLQEFISHFAEKVTRADCADMIDGWAGFAPEEQESVWESLNDYATDTGVDVVAHYSNMVDPPKIETAEPKGAIDALPSVDLQWESNELDEYIAEGRELCAAGKVRVSIAAGGPGARLLLKDGDFPAETKTSLKAKTLLSKPTMPVGPASGKGCITHILENLTGIRQETGVPIPVTIVETEETAPQIQKEIDVNGAMVETDFISSEQALLRPPLNDDKKIPTTFNEHGERVVVLQPGGTLDAFKPFVKVADEIDDDDTVLILYGDDPLLNDKDFIYSAVGARTKENADIMVVATPKKHLVEPFGGTVLGAEGKAFIVEVGQRVDVNEEGPHVTFDERRRIRFIDKCNERIRTTKDENEAKYLRKIVADLEAGKIEGLDLVEANMLWADVADERERKHLSFNTGVLVFSGKAAKVIAALINEFPLRIAANRQVVVRESAEDEDGVKIGIEKPEEYLTDTLALLQDEDALRRAGELTGVEYEQMRVVVANIDRERYGATKTWSKVEAAADIKEAQGLKRAKEELGIVVDRDSLVEVGDRFSGRVGDDVIVSDGAKVYLDGNAVISNNVQFQGPGIFHIVGDVEIRDGVKFIAGKNSAIRVTHLPKHAGSITIGKDSTLTAEASDDRRQILNVIDQIPRETSVNFEQLNGVAEIIDADRSTKIGLLPFDRVATASRFAEIEERGNVVGGRFQKALLPAAFATLSVLAEPASSAENGIKSKQLVEALLRNGNSALPGKYDSSIWDDISSMQEFEQIAELLGSIDPKDMNLLIDAFVAEEDKMAKCLLQIALLNVMAKSTDPALLANIITMGEYSTFPSKQTPKLFFIRKQRLEGKARTHRADSFCVMLFNALPNTEYHIRISHRTDVKYNQDREYIVTDEHGNGQVYVFSKNYGGRQGWKVIVETEGISVSRQSPVSKSKLKATYADAKHLNLFAVKRLLELESRAAKEALVGIRKEAVAISVGSLGSRYQHIRHTAAEVLNGLDWVPQSKQEEASYLIAQEKWGAVAKIGLPAVDPLVAVLKDESATINWQAVNLLAHMPSSVFTTLIRAALQNKDCNVREGAVNVLGRMKNPAAIETLFRVLRDKNRHVRQEAAYALKTLSWEPMTQEEKAAFLIARENWKEVAGIGKAAVPALITLLKDKDNYIRWHAVGALAEIGVDARAAIPHLIAVVDDTDFSVSRSAGQAIRKIRPDTKTPDRFAETPYTADDRVDLEGTYFNVARGRFDLNQDVPTIDRMIKSLPGLMADDVYTVRDTLVWARANNPGLFNLCEQRYTALTAEDGEFTAQVKPVWDGIKRTMLDDEAGDPHATGFEIGDPEQGHFGGLLNLCQTHAEGLETAGSYDELPAEIRTYADKLYADMQVLEKSASESHSGIRTVFDVLGRVTDGVSTNITDAAKLRTAAITKGWVNFVRNSSEFQQQAGTTPGLKPLMTVATDTRFTGQAIADVAVRAYLAEDARVAYTLVSNTVEAAIFARELEGAHGFSYITASHNPFGYNGFKVGEAAGKIISSEEALSLIESYHRNVDTRMLEQAHDNQDAAKLALFRYAVEIARELGEVSTDSVREVYESVGGYRRQSREVFNRVSDALITGRTDAAEIAERKEIARQAVASKDYWAVIDPCGGTAQEKEYLESLGLNVEVINDRMRFDVNHNPDPTRDDSMKDVALKMLEVIRDGRNVAVGIGYDTDSDRKNLVFARLNKIADMRSQMLDGKFEAEVEQAISRARGAERIEDFISEVGEFLLIPGVQNVFAFDVMERIAEIALREEWVVRDETGQLVLNPEITPERARLIRKEFGTCVNGATSIVAEQIDALVGTSTQRAETGEVNMVVAGEERQARLEVQGHSPDEAMRRVFLLAEGSNGSVFDLIFAKIRFPRQSYKTMLGFIAGEELFGADLFEVWCVLTGQSDRYEEGADLTEVINTLPYQETTSVFDSRGIYKGIPLDCPTTSDNPQDWLKGAFKVALRRHMDVDVVPEIKEQIAKEFGVSIADVRHKKRYYREQNEIDDISDDGLGGISIWFYVEDKPVMFLWVRASATEAEITRMMVSVAHWENTPEARETVHRLYTANYDRLRAALKEAERRVVEGMTVESVMAYGAEQFAARERIEAELPQSIDAITQWQEEIDTFKRDPFNVFVRDADRDRESRALLEALGVEDASAVTFAGLTDEGLRDYEWYVEQDGSVVNVVVNPGLKDRIEVQVREAVRAAVEGAHADRFAESFPEYLNKVSAPSGYTRIATTALSQARLMPGALRVFADDTAVQHLIADGGEAELLRETGVDLAVVPVQAGQSALARAFRFAEEQDVPKNQGRKIGLLVFAPAAELDAYRAQAQRFADSTGYIEVTFMFPELSPGYKITADGAIAIPRISLFEAINAFVENATLALQEAVVMLRPTLYYPAKIWEKLEQSLESFLQQRREQRERKTGA